MRKFAATALTALCFFAQSAHASATAINKESMAAVKAMLEAGPYRQIFIDQAAHWAAHMPQQVRDRVVARTQKATDLTEAQRKAKLAAIEAKMPGLTKSVQEMLGDPTLIDEMMDGLAMVYGRHFTVAELDELNAFYLTPAGAKAYALIPMPDEERNVMSAQYAGHFTEAERARIGEFYKTPVGAKSLKVMPLLLAELQQLGPRVLGPRIDEALKRFTKPSK